MLQLTDNVWAVEVPDNLLSPEYSFEMSIGRMLDLETEDDEFIIRYRERICGSPIGKITVSVPPGTYQFLFTTKTATEEDARKVVKCNQDFVRGAKVQMAFYENYEGKHSSFPSAIASLESLLRSKGLDPNKNYALIEKQTNE